MSRKRKPSNSFARGMKLSSRMIGDWGEAIQLPFGMWQPSLVVYECMTDRMELTRVAINDGSVDRTMTM